MVSFVLGRCTVMKSACGSSVVDRREQLDAERSGALLGDVGVVADEPHLEGARALGDERADAAEPDDRERLLVELRAGELAALPLARLQRRVRLADHARLRHEQRPRVLGRGHDVARSARCTRRRPRSVAAATSTLSIPTPARPMILRRSAASITAARGARRRAHDERVVGADDARPARPRSSPVLARRPRSPRPAASRCPRPRSCRLISTLCHALLPHEDGFGGLDAGARARTRSRARPASSRAPRAS